MEIAKDTVAVGYCYGQEVASGFCNSLAGLIAHELTAGAHLRTLLPVYSGVNISSGRNEIVEQFLAGDAEWLLMLDADMTFDRFIVEQLVEAADAENAPIVGALAFGVSDGELFPTLYSMVEENGGPQTIRFLDFPENEMFQVVGTGAACVLIHRRVLRAIADQEFSHAYPWFQEGEIRGSRVSEDMTFMLRAGQLGFPVFVHTGISVGHQKSYVLTADMYRSQRSFQLAMRAAEATIEEGTNES
jgi:hypothetical protein